MKKRAEIDPKDKWDLEKIYPEGTTWQKDYLTLKNGLGWVDRYIGQLGESAANLKEFLDKKGAFERKVELIYTYAHLKHDEDIENPQNKANYEKAYGLYIDYINKISFFEPEILALEKEKAAVFLASETLAGYKTMLERIFRLKPHTLGRKEEEMLSLSARALKTASSAFKALNDGDLTFGKVKNSQGEEKELTHGNYINFLLDPDRAVRETAFHQYYKTYNTYPQTMAALLSGVVQSHIFTARVRNYPNTLEAALFPDHIFPSVYKSLIQAVRDNIGVLHRYMALRKKVMKLEKLHLYDVYVPMIAEYQIRVEYRQAQSLFLDSIQPLGPEYVEKVHNGLFSGWVDKFENKFKRSGAYSSGCFDSMPYILLNYNGTFHDATTLAHEAGHSMHSLLSKENQPYIYASYPIFLAEVASTFNEQLFFHHMIQKAASKEEKLYLLNEQLEMIRTTLFRQTLFAEFELKIHEFEENDTPLTHQLLKDEYFKLNQFYFGPEVIMDEDIAIEWARIPHFYYNYYVYQYATGISAAIYLARLVLNGGEKERAGYLDILKSGNIDYPLEILKKGGVDMTTPLPVTEAIATFSGILDQIEAIL